MRLFHQALRDFLNKRFKQALGLGICLFSVFTVFSILLHAPSDAGFFSVSTFPLKHPLGHSAAFLADLFLGLFGGSIVFFFVTLAYAGFYFFKTKTILVDFLYGAFGAALFVQMGLCYTGQKGLIPYVLFCLVPAPKPIFFGGIIATFLLYFVPFKRLFRRQKRAAVTAPTPSTARAAVVEKPEPTFKSVVVPSHQDFALPSIELLDPSKNKSKKLLDSSYFENAAQRLEQVLTEYGIRGKIEQIHPGPVVTLYEFAPAPGIKVSRIISLCDDIARSMSALSARISVIPGQSVVGIELPNEKRKTVYLRELLETEDYQAQSGKLPLALGQNISGHPFVVDLSKMPHLLVAGTTGSGKSVAINTMILSLLYKLSPSQCRFVMIDPKMLELSVYDGIPHLLAPVVIDPKKAINALKWAVREMETRYNKMSKVGVRNIESYNIRMIESRERGQVLMKRTQVGFDQESGRPIFDNQPLEYEVLPHIVVVVDEMADLMMVAGKEIEVCVQRLAQMARAAGIHLIMATQRPSVDVITGTIKANFPTRISFHVTSKIDSRTILGEQGAEQLLGQGDMLYMASGGKITRVHGPFVNDQEVERVVAHLKQQGSPQFSINLDIEEDVSAPGMGSDDPLFEQAVNLVVSEGRVSISRIQRKFNVGYNKAAKLVEEMEEKGVVSTADHTGKRQILAG